MKKNITLANGNGGEENNELITKIFYKAFQNDILLKNEDAAIIENGNLAFTTDSFTISPIFFKGGDIGKLAVCGTCNDLAMMGAKPKYLSVGMIIEEGFPLMELRQIVSSMKKELEINETIIVSGDTKVMSKGTLDKIIINTSGIGQVKKKISSNNITNDQIILVNRDIGSHGASIFLSRENMNIESDLNSDCTSLYPQVKALLDANIKITALRDATRGGLAAVLNEWAKQSNVGIEINEEKIPINKKVFGVCEMLGFEAISLANEGTFLLVIDNQDGEKALEILKTFKTNKLASIIGKVTEEYKKKVILKSLYGTKKILEVPYGELLPRIC